MTRPAVLALGSYPPGEIEKLEALFDVHRYWEAADKAALMARIGPAVRGIATRGDIAIDPLVYANVPKLEVISIYGVGYDGIDLAWCRQRGVTVANTPGLMTEEVADVALALMLAWARQVTLGDAHVRSGAWGETGNLPLTPRFYGKRLGILGLGRIGKAIARRGEAFGMPIAYHGRARQADVAYTYCETPEAVAAQSDYLVAALTGGTESAGIVSAAVLKALGPKGVFINVARGSVADEAALLTALETGAIAGAGLDVFLNEPKIDPRFLKLTNTVYVPHIGSATHETRAAMGQMLRDQLALHFAGKPVLHKVV